MEFNTLSEMLQEVMRLLDAGKADEAKVLLGKAAKEAHELEVELKEILLKYTGSNLT